MSFERDLDISGDLEQIVKEERDSLALNIDRRVVQTTPFDTGAAKRNWLVSFGRPDGGQISAGRMGRSEAERMAMSEGAKNIESSAAYGVLYIQNNLPYIKRLNEGWSQGAPSKYVDAIIIQEVNR